MLQYLQQQFREWLWKYKHSNEDEDEDGLEYDFRWHRDGF